MLYHLEQPPKTSYLYEMADAAGAEVVKRVEPIRTVSQPRGPSGSRRRVKKLKPGRLYVPLVLDTEYQTTPNPDLGWFHEAVLEACHKIGRGSIPISVQIKGIHPDAPADVYLHPDYKKAFRKAKPDGLLQAPEPVIDYLARHLGAKVRLDWKGTLDDEDYKAVAARRTLRLHIFAHFAIADFLRIWGNREIVEHIKSLTRSTDDRAEPWIVQGRRLRCARQLLPGAPPVRWLPLPAIVVIDGRKFALELDIFDNSAMLGNAGRSLKGFHSCAGVPMDAKDNYSRENKERMLLQFIRACDPVGLADGAYGKLLPSNYDLHKDPLVAEGGPSVFLDYARGDVMTLYKAIDGVANQFRRVYHSMGLDPYYRDPKPTTGSTVHDLIRATVYRKFEGAFADAEELLTKSDAKLVDRAIFKGGGSAAHGLDHLTTRQQENFPRWFLGIEEAVPVKFRRLIEEIGFEPAEAKKIATADNWSGLNAKVFGGRCVNSAPTLIGAKGLPIADVDLAGCYVAAMYQQEFPVGRPVVIGRAYGRKSKRNRYLSLREFLAEYRSELVPSLWQAWISVEDEKGNPLPLPVDQDYYPSWQAPTSFFDHDSEEEGVWLERTDQVRHYLREITNTVLTHDGLQWLELVASRKLRDFVMTHGKVKTAMFYPRSGRVSSAKEFVHDYCTFLRRNEEGNRSKAVIKKGRTKVVDEVCEFDGWFSVRLSDLIADSLKKKRGEFKTITAAYKAIKRSEVKLRTESDIDRMEEGNRAAVRAVLDQAYPGGLAALVEEAGELAKHPLDELFKLCGNTVYGVVVSRFFQLSNPVVGNNITSRCRSVIALYQAACLGWNAITDGGLMRLDRVLFPRKAGADRRITERASMLVEATNTELNAADLKAAPIGGYKSIRWEGDHLVFEKPDQTLRFHKSEARTPTKTGYLDLIDDLILHHVRSSFPEGIDVLAPDSPFTFETKGVVQDAAIHGAGNYYLRGGSHEGYPEKGAPRMVKMRSYSSTIHETRLIPFFEQLLDDPSKLDRTNYSEPFVVSRILMTGAYAEQFESYYRETILEPGDTIYEARFFRELGLSGFRFLNHEQEASWTDQHNHQRQVGRDKTNNLGQSLEGFFIDEEGWLDYRKMLKEANSGILRGKKTFRKTSPEKHPQTDKLQILRRSLRKMFLSSPKVTIDPYEDPYDREVNAGYIHELELLYYQELPDEAWL